MLTRNWYNVLMTTVIGGTITDGLKYYNGTVANSVRPTNGSLDNYLYWRYSTAQTDATSTSMGGIYFGTGTTAPTFDDYKLSGSIISGISVSESFSQENDDANVLGSRLFTVTNNNSEAITISEIAWFGYGYYTTSYVSNPVLFDRTVLDTPVTIPAGGVGQVTYTIRMDYPTE